MPNSTSLREQKQILVERILTRGRNHGFCLNSADKILLTVLASSMGIGNISWLPYEELLEDTSIGSKTTLNNSIEKLEKLLIIKVKRKHRKNNKYIFTKQFLEYAFQMFDIPREDRIPFSQFIPKKKELKSKVEIWLDNKKK